MYKKQDKQLKFQDFGMPLRMPLSALLIQAEYGYSDEETAPL